MYRYLPAVLLVLAGIWLERESAEGDQEVTRFEAIEAQRITLRAEGRAVVISPDGIWLEREDGHASYVEADKFALSRLSGRGRRNLASLVGSASDGTAGLVFYGRGAAPRMVVQSTRDAGGLTVYNDAGRPRLVLIGGETGSRLHVWGPDGKVRGHFGTEPRVPTEDDPAVESGVTFVLYDAAGAEQVRLPGPVDR